MKRFGFSIGILSVMLWLVPVFAPSAVQAATYTPLTIVDDSVFDNYNSMNESQIQAYLSTKNTTDFTNDQLCLSNYPTPDVNYDPTNGWIYGANVATSHLIYKAAQQWHLNPQVILATLEKEEALPHGNDCSSWRYSSAMGYACPSTCDPHYAGVTKQIWWGSWQLKFNRMRSEGSDAGETPACNGSNPASNLNWDRDGDLGYGQAPQPDGSVISNGRMTAGTRCTILGGTAYTYNGNTTLADGGTYLVQNGATASLLTYTPFYPQTFTKWFNEIVAFNAGPQCATQTDVYRFWSPRFNNAHFFTADINEYSRVLADPNWRYEGIGFCGLSAPATNYSAVYRFWSPKFNNVHFYTASLDEKTRLMSDANWTYEGIAFYEPTDPATDNTAVAVNRYWSPKFNNDHFFTASVSEQNALKTDPNWTFEGIGWYAEMPQ